MVFPDRRLLDVGQVSSGPRLSPSMRSQVSVEEETAALDGEEESFWGAFDFSMFVSGGVMKEGGTTPPVR